MSDRARPGMMLLIVGLLVLGAGIATLASGLGSGGETTLQRVESGMHGVPGVLLCVAGAGLAIAGFFRLVGPRLPK